MRASDDSPDLAAAVEAYLREQREESDRAVQGAEDPGGIYAFACAPEGTRLATPAEVRAFVEALDDVVGRGAEVSVVAFALGVLCGAVLAGLCAAVIVP